MFDTVRRAMTDPDPLQLLDLVSALLATLDPRGRDHPFAQLDRAAALPSREDLVTMFIDVEEPESTVLLTVIGALADDDEILSARIRRALAQRSQAGPQWLEKLAETSVHRAVRMADALGDGDNIMLGVRLAGSHELTVIAYVDHNFGGLVKDAFVLPQPINSTVDQYERVSDGEDLFWEELSLADARAWFDDAIRVAAMSFPPIETESWPACRALIEWITRRLSDGGSGYQRPLWSPDELAELKEKFFASKWGHPLGSDDFRELLDPLLWYATDYGSGDPLRWGPAKVGILLTEWLPRKVAAPPGLLVNAPDLLWAFVNFAHEECGVPTASTEKTLTVIDACTPEYLQMIASTFHSPEYEDPHWSEELQLDHLARFVGGPDELDQLDTVPLRDESFDWSGIPEDITEKVAEVLELTDRWCIEFLDSIEYRTVTRRVLARVASRGQ